LLTWCWRPKTLSVLMDPRPLLPFIFLLRSLVCVFLLSFFFSCFWNRVDDEEAGLLGVCFDSGFSLFAGAKANDRANTRLCVLLLSCSLRLSVYYFFLWIYALFFLCSFLRFLVFCLGLASVFPFFFFCASLLWLFYSRRMACVSLGNEDSGPFIAGAVMAGASVSLVWWAEEDEQFSWNDAVRLLMAICVSVLDVLEFS